MSAKDPAGQPVQPCFWLVYCVDTAYPMHTHATEAEAWAEAEKLAREDTEKTFVVLRSVGGARVAKPIPPPVERIPVSYHDTVPF